MFTTVRLFEIKRPSRQHVSQLAFCSDSPRKDLVTMKKRCIACLALSVLAFCSLPAQKASAQNTAIDPGENHYRALLSRNPQDATSHYYMANYLAKRMRAQEAIREYRTALSLSPNGPVATYCREALAAYGVSSIPPSPLSSTSSFNSIHSGNFNPNLPGNESAGDPNLPGQGTAANGSLSKYAQALLRNELRSGTQLSPNTELNESPSRTNP